MAFADDPVWLDGLTYSSQEMRRVSSMMLMADGTAGGALGGVRPGDPGLKVSLAGMAITVPAGVAAVVYPSQGTYRAFNSTAWTGTVNTAHASLARIDLVYLRVWDNAVDGAGLAKGDVVYLAGTAGAGTAPTPSGTLIYILLATINVPAGSTTPSATDVRPLAIAPGGITPNGTVTGLYAGQYRDNPSTGAMERWSGSAWVQYPLALGGIAPAGLASGSYTGQYRDNATGLPDRWSGSAWVPQAVAVSYVPTWAGLSVLGSSTKNGRVIVVGKLAHVVAELTWGTSSSLGTGSISVTLPFTAATVPGNLGWQGTGRYNDGAGHNWKSLVPYIASGASTATVFAIQQSDVGWVSPGTAGYTWASGATMRVEFDYEIA